MQERLRNLPEELEFTEPEWYEYHYQLRRNGILLDWVGGVGSLGVRIVEPRESYAAAVLAAAGHRVEVSAEFPVENGAVWDRLLLLGALEEASEPPARLLGRARNMLAPGGRLLVAASHLAQFRNRLKLLAGRSLVLPREAPGLPAWPGYTMEEMERLMTSTGWTVCRKALVSPYPACRMEPLGLGRYLLKHVNRLAMQLSAGLRDVLLVEADPGEGGP